MESFGILFALALGIIALGFLTLNHSWRITRTAVKAWYAIQGRQMAGRARSLRIQAGVLFFTGAILLVWMAYRLSFAERNGTSFATATPFPTSTIFVPTMTSPPTTELPATPLPPTAQTLATPQSGTVDTGQDLVPIPTPIIGSEAVVANTGGGGLWMRDAPFGNLLVLLPEDSIVIVQGGQLEVNGVLWQRVLDLDGREGWVAADYLLYR